jgi:hypothetical protein
VTKVSCDEQNQHIAIASEKDRATAVRDEVVELESKTDKALSKFVVSKRSQHLHKIATRRLDDILYEDKSETI